VEIVAVEIVAVEIVAVEIVAVEIVAWLFERVPIVAVPFEMATLELKVAAPVTLKLEARVVAPTALSVPVELTPRVDSSKAEEVLSPSVMACSVPSTPPRPRVLSNCGS